MLKKIPALFVFSFVFLCSLLKAQECQPPAIVANIKSDNLFSAEQETILGEMILQQMSGEVRLVKDSNLEKYLNEIGQRLIKHLPPTGLKFQFHLIDISDANAYNIPGGHILVSRKLISFSNSEDELAGVIAHELGHATVHHGATDISRSLRKILKINSLGDRKDVEEKFNLLIENSRTKRVSQKVGHEDGQQMEADKIGLYAMIAAGYDSDAFYTFFDRLTESEGKTGNWFSDFFEKTTPAQKRLREMVTLFEQIPQNCRTGRKSSATEDFLNWQAKVVSFQSLGRTEELPGLLWKQELNSKLRSDVSRIVVSRDGKYFAARDDFSLTIIEREPLRVLFQIAVEGIDDVYFTPDNQSIVFVTDNLRFERWNIAEKKPSEIRELVFRRNCMESRLSPDGNFLACIDSATNINILDTRTGKRVFQKKQFYNLNYFEYISWLSRTGYEMRNRNFFRIEFSPDSKTVLLSRSNYFRSNIRLWFVPNFSGVSQNTALALDLKTFKQIEMDGSFKSITSRPYAFLDSQRILGMPSNDPKNAGIFSFPDGKRLHQIPFYAREIRTTGNPDYVIVKPLENSAMGVFDVKNNVIVAGMNKQDAAVWNNLFIYESVSGKLIIRETKGEGKEKTLSDKDLATIEVPVAAVGNLNAVQVSNNFNWLIMSSKTRGGLWDTASGDRKVFARGFRGGIIADDGNTISEFPKYEESEHTLALLSPKTKQVAVFQNLPEKGARQFGRFVLLRTSLKEKEPDTDEDKNTSAVPDFDDSDIRLRGNVRFELKNFVENKIVWSRDFPQYAPFYSFDAYSGRLILYWHLGSEAGRAALKDHPEVKGKIDALKNPEGDYLIEIIDAFEGKTIGSMLVETGQGSFRVRTGSSEGDWLLLYDSTDRMLAYSIKSGELRQRFFGKYAAVNPIRNQIAVENFPGEVVVYDLETGERQASFVINSEAAFLRFNPEGNKLFILSAAQSAYAFDLNKIYKSKPKL